MVDIASLGFGIDSSPVVRSHEALDLLAQRARAAEQSVQGFGQQVSLANSGFVTFTSGLGTATTHLSQMAASLQTVVGHLQLYRREIDLSAASFENFGKARDRVEALATSLGTSAVALENFSRQSSVVGMTSLETASAVQRVTAAIEGQTAAGRQLREVMQDYGVVLTGMSASNADQVLARFIDQARQYRATPGNTRVVNEVLGPLSVEATTSILSPDYEPVAQRRARIAAETRASASAEMMDSATQVIRDTRRRIEELSDLRRYYDVGRMSQEQRTDVFAGMDVRPSSLNNPTDELAFLRYIERSGTDAQREAARRPQGLGRLLYGEWSTNRFLPDLPSIPGGVMDAARGIAGPNGDGGSNPMWMIPNAVEGFIHNRLERPEIASRMANVQAQSLLRLERDGMLGGASTLLFGGASVLFGGDPTVKLTPDSRALSAVEVARQRAAAAQRLSDVGVMEPAAYESAAARLRSLARGEGKDTQSDIRLAMMRAFVVPTGQGGDATQGDINAAALEANPRFDNMYDLALQAQDDAMSPGAGRMRQLDIERWLRSVPSAQRGEARALLGFAGSNGVSTRQWASRGVSPTMLLSGMVDGAGALSPAQRGAFSRIQASENQSYAADSGEELLQQIDVQSRIREAIAQGGAAVEEATAKWQAYYAALRAGRNEDQAKIDSERALTETIMRRTTAIEAEADAMRRQENSTYSTDLLVQGAGYDPVARAQARIEGGLAADFAQRAAAGRPGAGTEYEAGRRRQISAEGLRGADDIRAQTEAMVDQQRRITQVAGARADVQARLASDLQVEAQFAERLAQARAGDKDNVDAVTRKLQEQMAAVKQLRGEYDQLRTAAANAQYIADSEWQGGFSRALAGLPPAERRLAQENAENIRNGPPTAFLGAFGGPTGSQWDSAFQRGSNASGGIFSPQMMAALARLESTMDPGARNGSVAGLMQFQPGTARDMGLTVSGDVDERLNPEKSIEAAGRYVQQLARQAGITGPVTSLEQVYRILERYGTVARGGSLPANREAIVTGALAAQTPEGQTRAWLGTPMAAARRGQAEGDNYLANYDADQDFAVQQARSRAILRLTAAGGGDFGRQLGSAIVVDPRSPIGGDDAMRRVRGVITSRQEGIATQAAGLEETARSASELAEAYRRSREEGEAFERHLGNNALVSALRNTAKEFPQVAKEIEGMAVQLERLNPLLDRAAANRAGGQFWQGVRRDQRQGEFYQADIDAGWWASPSRRGEERARLQARQIAEDTRGADTPVDEKTAFAQRSAIERQRELYEETRNTRQEFDRLKISAMSAFEGAVLGGKDLSGILQALGQDIARFAMRIGPERLLMKGLESGADWIGGAITGAGKGGDGIGDSVASGFSAVANLFSWFGADGLVISNGVPHRNAASGMLLNRPTTFMAQGGTVTAGEVNDEAIFPLKRDASGNLGIRAAGGGPSVVINAPITVEGGATKGGQGGGMEPAALAQIQRDLERTINQAVRNSITNERRDGGDLYL